MPTGKAKAGTVGAVSACGLIVALGNVGRDLLHLAHPPPETVITIPRHVRTSPRPTMGADGDKQFAAMVYARISSRASRRFADSQSSIGHAGRKHADEMVRAQLSRAAGEVAAADPEDVKFESAFGNLTVFRNWTPGRVKIEVGDINAYAWADAAVPGVMACTRLNSDKAKLGSCVDAALADAGKSLSAATGQAATQRSAPGGERRGEGKKAG